MKAKGVSKVDIIQKLFSMAGEDHHKMLILLKGQFTKTDKCMYGIVMIYCMYSIMLDAVAVFSTHSPYQNHEIALWYKTPTVL